MWALFITVFKFKSSSAPLPIVLYTYGAILQFSLYMSPRLCVQLSMYLDMFYISITPILCLIGRICWPPFKLSYFPGPHSRSGPCRFHLPLCRYSCTPSPRYFPHIIASFSPSPRSFRLFLPLARCRFGFPFFFFCFFASFANASFPFWPDSPKRLPTTQANSKYGVGGNGRMYEHIMMTNSLINETESRWSQKGLENALRKGTERPFSTRMPGLFASSLSLFAPVASVSGLSGVNGSSLPSLDGKRVSVLCLRGQFPPSY